MAGPLNDLLAAGEAERELLDFPARDWVPPRRTAAGEPVLNVLVIGAGQAGLSILAALKRDHVGGILAVDAAAEGEEGPWRDIARMTVLRTPKELSGPEMRIPSFSFRRWYSALHGEDAWEALEQIPRLAWRDYLSWIREAWSLPVRNGIALERIEVQGEYLAAHVRTATGRETLLTRKIVLATGVEGGGGWFVPDAVKALPQRFWAHTADRIDFAALKGKRVAVIGAGASAMDNAATALEAGAATVHQFCRRPEPQPIQPLKWASFPGFLRHFGDMGDAWRWRFMAYILGLREPFTKDAWRRVQRFANFRFRTGEACNDLRVADNKVLFRTADGVQGFDFVICGTGVNVDHRLRPELAGLAEHIALWRDRYTPPAEEADARLGGFPYLSPGFTFVEKQPGACPALANIHCFNFAASLSLGPSGAAIRPLRFAVPRLVSALTHDLFAGDLAIHWQSLRAWSAKEFEDYPMTLGARETTTA